MPVLGQEPVARVKGINVGYLGGADDAVDPQIAFACRRFADTDRLVCQLDVHRVGIDLRVNGDRADVQLLARPDDADRYLTAIGYENLLKHAASSGESEGSPGQFMPDAA